MAAEERIEYHWIENRLVQKRLTRPLGTKAWRFNSRTSTLVATIEPRNRSFYLRDGRAATPERVVDCVRWYKGVLVDDSTLDYAGSMPIAIREEFRARLNNVISSALKQWDTFAEETDITGYLKGELHGIVVERDGWRISMRAWTYDRNPKEKLLGLDLGIIFDVIYLGRRLVKATWYQAKIAEEKPISLNTLPDLSEQVEKMQHHTKEAYILIYTKDGIFTAREVSENNFQPFSDNMVDGAVCERGDRTPEVVAHTVDIKHVLTCFVTGPEAELVERETGIVSQNSA